MLPAVLMLLNRCWDEFSLTQQVVAVEEVRRVGFVRVCKMSNYADPLHVLSTPHYDAHMLLHSIIRSKCDQVARLRTVVDADPCREGEALLPVEMKWFANVK